MTAVELAERLPSISTVRASSQSFAVLDAILSPNGYATYTFDSRWSDAQELASMDNGSGDEYSIVFTASGAFIRGFDHESMMSPYADDDYALWPGLVESVPEQFAAQATEPAFYHHGGAEPFLAATVCLWRLHDDPAWRTGDIEFPPREEGTDGSDWMFELLTKGTPEVLPRLCHRVLRGVPRPRRRQRGLRAPPADRRPRPAHQPEDRSQFPDRNAQRRRLPLTEMKA